MIGRMILRQTLPIMQHILQAGTCAGVNPVGLPFSSPTKAVITVPYIVWHCINKVSHGMTAVSGTETEGKRNTQTQAPLELVPYSFTIF